MMIALRLQMPVRRLLRECNSRELAEWIAFFRLDEFRQQDAQVRTKQMKALLFPQPKVKNHGKE